MPEDKIKLNAKGIECRKTLLKGLLRQSLFLYPDFLYPDYL